jgi:short subunit dehydrogenase-like uncharacterized protein
VSGDRELDVVVFGATGYAGRLVAGYLAGHGPAVSASVAALARAARVVVTTVGSYRGQGLALVAACAAAGTDYADLTGEVLFIRDSIDRCHDVAAGAGARIVHGCGFDSVPSDLGVLLLHHAARAGDAGYDAGRDGAAGRYRRRDAGVDDGAAR